MGIQQFFDGQLFTRIDFRPVPPGPGEYDECIFRECNFTGTDLSGFRFLDCTFESCDLSLAKITSAVFTGARFKNCKMLGLLFGTSSVNGFSAAFENCTADHSSFEKLKMKKMVFMNTSLQDTDFTGCDLGGAVFAACDLRGAQFIDSNLEEADFRTAFNYSIDPERNRMKKARFSLAGLPGLLGKYSIITDNE